MDELLKSSKHLKLTNSEVVSSKYDYATILSRCWQNWKLLNGDDIEILNPSKYCFWYENMGSTWTYWSVLNWVNLETSCWDPVTPLLTLHEGIWITDNPCSLTPFMFLLKQCIKENWISRVVYSTLKNVGLISGISLSCFATQFIKGYWIRGLEKMFRVADGIFFCEIGLKNLPINIYSFKLSLIKPQQYWLSI